MSKTKIHKGDLIDNYLPADYLDSFSKEVETKENITPDDFFNMAFNQFPAWIDWLLKLKKHNCQAFGIGHHKSFFRFYM